MKSHDCPTSEEVHEDLIRVWPTVFDAIEVACQDLRGWFDERGEPVNHALAHNMVRYIAIQHLEQLGLDASLDDVEREPLANNGISLRVGRYHLRFRKLGANGVPVPGQSQVLQDFYDQQMTFAFGDADDEAPDAPAILTNILVLWEVTAEYKFVGLHLACPASGGDSRHSVSLYWGPTAIPHPALAASAPGTPAADHDLPIEPGDAAAGTPADTIVTAQAEEQLLAEPIEASGTSTTAPELDEIKRQEQDDADERGTAGMTG